MKYIYGKKQPIFTAQFLINLFIIDVIVIFAVIIGAQYYRNYQVMYQAKTINEWCQHVMCVRFDPATGIGEQVMPEVVPQQAMRIEEV